MKTLRFIPLALLVALLASCSSIRVATDWDRATDFSRFETWDWAEESQKTTGNVMVDDDSLLAKRVYQAVERQLASQGFRRDTSGGADFEIAFFLVVEDKMSVTTINNHYGYAGGWGPHYGYHTGWGYGPGGFGSQTVVDQYKEGTLVLDIMLGEPPSLIWRGSGSARLREKSTPEQSTARVNEAVRRILEKFPPR